MTENTTNDIERGPNGFPYADIDGTRVSRWESGDYLLKVERSDGEKLPVNLRPAQLRALNEAIEHVMEGSER